MIVVNVAVNVKPEQKSAFLATIEPTIAKARQFEGCLKFGVYEDISAANQFILYEEWATQEAFNVYGESAHPQEVRTQLMPLLAGEPESAYYQASLIN